jgi:hypothetical protein
VALIKDNKGPIFLERRLRKKIYQKKGDFLCLAGNTLGEAMNLCKETSRKKMRMEETSMHDPRKKE